MNTQKVSALRHQPTPQALRCRSCAKPVSNNMPPEVQVKAGTEILCARCADARNESISRISKAVSGIVNDAGSLLAYTKD